jgi:hypothetical protein
MVSPKGNARLLPRNCARDQVAGFAKQETNRFDKLRPKQPIVGGSLIGVPLHQRRYVCELQLSGRVVGIPDMFSFAIRNPGREMRQSSGPRWGSYIRG